MSPDGVHGAAGTAIRVILLHGLGADRRAFQRFARLLPSDWMVDALDLLGHGPGPHTSDGAYTLDDMAEHAAEQIAQLLDVSVAAETDDAPVVVGHSLGAAVAIALAAEYPNLVRRLVLLDPAQTRGTGESAPERHLNTNAMMQAKRDGTLDAAVDGIFPAESPALRRWIVETWTQMAPGVIRDFDPSWDRYVAQISCPVTVLHGDIELGGAGEEPGQIFGHRADSIRVAGAGHNLHATHARETATLVTAAVDAMYARSSAEV